MGDLTKNLSRSEFACKGKTCGCSQDTIDYKLVEIIQDVRDHFGKSVTITSGNRCPIHNAEIGGAKSSQHLLGRAGDVQVSGVDAGDVYEYVDGKYPTSLGLGKYKTFTHIDTRNLMARWHY